MTRGDGRRTPGAARPVALALVAWLATGCASDTYEDRLVVHDLFDTAFVGLEAPAPKDVAGSGEPHVMAGASPERVYRSALLVLMQRGAIVHADRSTGVIVRLDAPPLLRTFGTAAQPPRFPHAVWVEPRAAGGAIVHAAWLDDLYRRVDPPHEGVYTVDRADRRQLAERFFERLETEVRAGERWPWLADEAPDPGPQGSARLRRNGRRPGLRLAVPAAVGRVRRPLFSPADLRESASG